MLNEARKRCPGSVEVWVMAAKLEEANNDLASTDRIVARAVTTLADKGVVITREQWLREAVACEATGNFATCQALACAFCEATRSQSLTFLKKTKQQQQQTTHHRTGRRRRGPQGHVVGRRGERTVWLAFSRPWLTNMN